MKRFLLLVEKKLITPLGKISQQRHLAAVRQGLLAVFPLSLIGSAFLLITNLPFPDDWAIQQFIEEHSNTILIPYRMTVVLITLYMVVGVGAYLARYYRYSPVSGSLVALASFLMTQIPRQPSAMVPQEFLDAALQAGLDTSWMESLEALGWVLSQSPMSGIGIYAGALAAITGVEILHLYTWLSQRRKKLAQQRKRKPKRKSQIPAAVLETLETILPVLLVVVIMFIIRDVIGFDFQQVTLRFFSTFISAANSLPGAMFFTLLMSLFSFFGVIGYSVQGSAAGVTWSMLLTANRVAWAMGDTLPNVAPLPFFQFFIWMGGVGSTLCLVVLLCASKSRYLKRLGYSSLLPSLLNISTPVLYGLPVILNPYMLIPFTLGPMVTTFISYLCLQFNFVTRPHATANKSMPFLIGAYLSTGDWRAIVLCVVNFAITLAIYLPFFKMYEQKLMAEGEAKAASGALDEDEAPRVTEVE